MTHLKFDTQIIDALETLGFIVADNLELAQASDYMEVSVIRVANTAEAEFQFTVTLPTGGKLTCFARRREVLAAVR